MKKTLNQFFVVVNSIFSDLNFAGYATFSMSHINIKVADFV
jgi:hypothetical protein